MSTVFRSIISRLKRVTNTTPESSILTGIYRYDYPLSLLKPSHIALGTNSNAFTLSLYRRHSSTSSASKPRLNAVIVGAGPSGFYTAKYLSSAVSKLIAKDDETDPSENSSSAEPFNFSGIDIDIVERLPTPYGLVRYGVAPDHPEVKNVENDFASVTEAHAANRSDNGDVPCTISYFGNVDVGHDISLQQLSSLYHIVVLAYGCQSDRNLGIPGLDLQGVLSARQFVNWYNGHPEFGYIGDIVRNCLWPNAVTNKTNAVSKAQVVVIGNGNVALDCARVLAKGARGLASTDTPSTVLDVLGEGVKKVTVAGRRGHIQGAFTIKELRELTKLKKEGYDASFFVRQDELDMGMTESSIQELKAPSGRPKKRIDALLHDAAAQASHDDESKIVELRLLLNPLQIEHADQNDKQVGAVVFERTKLEGEPGMQKATSTGELEKIDADLVITSVGYKGEPLEGMDDNMFDSQRGVITNNHGKVFGDNNMFATGWIKRGPSGIIGTNITDAKDTVASIMKYITSDGGNNVSNSGADLLLAGRTGLLGHLNSQRVKAVTWDQFLQIDRAERDRKRLRSEEQPREKILLIKEMLDCLN